MCIPPNTCFPGPIQVRHGISIGSAILHSSRHSISILYNGPLSPQNCPFPQGRRPSNTWFLGCIRATIQTVSRSVHRFLHSSPQSVPILSNGPPSPHRSKLSLAMGDLDPNLIHGSWVHPSSQPKMHLDRFGRYCRLTSVTDRQTGRRTDHTIQSVTIGRIHVRT